MVSCDYAGLVRSAGAKLLLKTCAKGGPIVRIVKAALACYRLISDVLLISDAYAYDTSLLRLCTGSDIDDDDSVSSTFRDHLTSSAE